MEVRRAPALLTVGLLLDLLASVRPNGAACGQVQPYSTLPPCAQHIPVPVKMAKNRSAVTYRSLIYRGLLVAAHMCSCARGNYSIHLHVLDMNSLITNNLQLEI